jgi:preprotein translocase subunit YajC
MMGNPAAPNPIVSLMPIILIFIVFYFLLIRPQHKKEKERQKMLSQLQKNDGVIAAGGIHGTIVNVKDTTVILKVDDNVKLEVEKNSILCLKK